MILSRWALHGGFWLKAALVLALVALADWLFFEVGIYGGAFGLFGLALLLAMLAARPALWRDRRAGVGLALAATYALAMAWDASLLAWCLFWIAAGMATLIPRTAAFDDGWRWFQRLFLAGFFALFGPLVDAFSLLKVRRRRKVAGRLGARAGALILPVVGSALIVSLFAAANPLIEQALSALSLPSLDEDLLPRLLVAGFIALISWGLLRPRHARHLFGTFDGRGDAAIPGVSVASVTLSLVAFNALFAVQNGLDLAYLWGLMPLPDGMTLAEYAHRGAYPLIVTALLAGAFVLVALRPGSTTAQAPLVRPLVIGWIGQNVFLVFSSILRTLDYVDAYSLTILRLSALLWMALVATGLVLVCWRLLANRSGAWLINANLAAAGLLLSGVAFVDLGEVSARWNVRHAREIDGSGAMLDLCYLRELGPSALLPLIELEDRLPEADLRGRVRNLRIAAFQQLDEGLRDGGWSWLGERRLAEARRLLGAKAAERVDPRGMSCDGTILAPALTLPPEQ